MLPLLPEPLFSLRTTIAGALTLPTVYVRVTVSRARSEESEVATTFALPLLSIVTSEGSEEVHVPFSVVFAGVTVGVIFQVDVSPI